VGLGLPVVETGKRGKMLFDSVKCREWLEAHRRTVVGEGRPRVKGDVEARKKRHELDSSRGPGKSKEKTPEKVGAGSPPPRKAKEKRQEKTPRGEAPSGGTQKEEPEADDAGDGLPDLGDKSPAELLAMVAREEIGPGHVSLFKQALEAMELTVDFRRRMKDLVVVADVTAALAETLRQARGILDRLPEQIVAIVGEVISLDDGQRHRVREGARKEVGAVIDQLAGRK